MSQLVNHNGTGRYR